MNIRSRGMLALALAGVAAGSAPALAADSYGSSDETTAVRVKLAAVTPETARDAQRSLTRLGNAALEACGASFHSLPDYKDAVRRSDCWHESMRDAVTRIGNPYLTAAYRRGGTVNIVASADATTINAGQ